MSASSVPVCALHCVAGMPDLHPPARFLSREIVSCQDPFFRGAGKPDRWRPQPEPPLPHDPTVALRGASTNEYRTRRTQRDQLVRIHRQVFIVERTVVLQKISGEPMILARPCEIPDLFSEMPPVQLRPALARRTDVRNGKA